MIITCAIVMVLIAELRVLFNLSPLGHAIVIIAGSWVGGLIGYGLYLIADNSWMEWPDPEEDEVE